MAGVCVQPVAIQYPAADGTSNRAAVFIDDMTFVESLRNVLGAGGITAELAFGEPIAPAGRTRRQLARMSREAIVAALAMPAAASYRSIRPAVPLRPGRRTPRWLRPVPA